MSEEPGGWELRRALEQIREDVKDGLAGINQRMDKLVTTEAFQAEQRRVEDKFKDLNDDIAAERSARINALAEEKLLRERGDENQQKLLDRLTSNMRWIAAAIILPVALFIANLLMQSRGGA